MKDFTKDIPPKASVASASASDDDRRRDEARRLFPEEALQHLDRESAARCQELLGHGNCFGIWETPDAMIGRLQSVPSRRVDLRKRLTNFMPEDTSLSPSLDALLDEAVLWMTRYAILLRIGPAGMSKGKNRPLDATTTAGRIYKYVSKILAQGILRRLEFNDLNALGIAHCLTPDDVRRWNTTPYFSVELKRMRMLADRGLWGDVPPKHDITKTTSPKGPAVLPQAQRIPTPHPPIPDDYLSEMGPRVLWLVQDLGPNLLALFEDIPELFGDIQFNSGKGHSKAMQNRLRQYLAQHKWFDRNGAAIDAPPFRLRIGRGKPTKYDPYAWPPQYWENMPILAVTLQSAHLWIALLAMAGRISEIATLKRNCIEWGRDEKHYVNGKTFKLSANLAGEDREWPAPEVFVQALAQQVRLVSAWERIARVLKGANHEDSETVFVAGDHLWASLGLGGGTDPEDQLYSFGLALRLLTQRLDLTSKPGGKNLHPHRFRKTIARLAGIAIVDSPRVLMKLLGHKDISMTLHYILTDKALQVEIEQVARELRIMRCQEVLEDIHTAIHTPEAPKYGGHGGGGAPGLVEAIKTHEEELHRSGRRWDADSSYELSVILTGNGQFFRVTRPGVVCLKESREAGPCSCDSTCINRIEEKTTRRDVREVIPILIAEGKRALAENQLLLVADKVQQINEEILRFDDINEIFDNHPDVIVLREAVA